MNVTRRARPRYFFVTVPGESLSYSFGHPTLNFVMNFNVLPSLVALAILVVVFRAILLQGAAERLQLWLTAWILVLVHFVAQFLDVGNGLWERTAGAVSLGALELASIAFLISMSPQARDRRRQLLLGAVLGVPGLAYTTGVVCGVTAHAFYYGVAVVGFLATSLLVWSWYRKTSAYLLYVCGLVFAALALFSILILLVAHNNADLGINVILAGLNFIVALLYWRHFRRATAGVLTTVFGFVAWGAVFPLACSCSCTLRPLWWNPRPGTSPSTLWPSE